MNENRCFTYLIFCISTVIFIPFASAQYAGERSFSDPVYSPETPLRVYVEIYGISGMVTVKETPPVGWTVSNISNHGRFSDGVITWNLPSFLAYQKLSYLITPPAAATEDIVFTGQVDGNAISGLTALSPYTETICKRVIPSAVYFPDEALQVQIQITAHQENLAIQEIPPEGWTISTVTNKGFFAVWYG